MADELSSWVSAACAVVMVVGTVINVVILRPMGAKMSTHEKKIEDQGDRIDKIDEVQQKRLDGVKSDSTRILEDLRDRMQRHEDLDAERFDDQSERMDSRLLGFRREIAEGHTSAVASIKVDLNTAISGAREDIRALATRFDGMMTMIAQLGRRTNQAPGDD